MKILLVEPAKDRGALSVARALAAAGWSVGIAAQRRSSVAGASRAVDAVHRIPDASGEVAGFCAAIGAVAREHSYGLIMPGAGDAELQALSLHRELLPAIVPYAPHENVMRALDKLSLTEAARAAGLPVPLTAEVTEGKLRSFSYPAVVKTRVPVSLGGGRFRPRVEAQVATGPDEARGLVDRVRAAGGAPLLQEMVSGGLIALSLVVDREGRAVARLQQHSERIWPPGAGISARARTVAIDEALAERALALMRELGWFGLAQLQFLDPGAGDPVLLDFNGRPYGSLALALAAGVNLPGTWVSLATGKSVAARDATPGVTYQWLEGDLRAGRRNLGPLAALRDSLRYARGAAHSVWRWNDPGPALRYAGQRIADGLERLRRRRSVS